MGRCAGSSSSCSCCWLAGCTSAAEPGGEEPGTLRLLVAGTVDLGGTAAVVALSDPESLFREVRLLARRADLAVVVAAAGDGAEALLAAAGFDAVACPEGRAPGSGRRARGDASAL